MPTAKPTFHELIQGAQDVAMTDPNQEQMVSKVFFTLDIGDQHYSGMSAVLRQPFGTNYAEEPVEVEKPSGPYPGNLNYNQFRDHAEDYYRSAIGNQGFAIRIGPGASNIRMRNNSVKFSKTYDLDIPN
jgi:hypothetical protein